jgi:hypothetical protein
LCAVGAENHARGCLIDLAAEREIAVLPTRQFGGVVRQWTTALGTTDKRHRVTDYVVPGTVRRAEGRHYSCRVSGGGSVVLVDKATETVAAVDRAHMRFFLWLVGVGRAKFKARCVRVPETRFAVDHAAVSYS